MNINIETLTIEAKSFHENYIKESSGSKPCTVRVLTDEEWRQVRQLEGMAMEKREAVTLVLKDVDSDSQTRRQITDISLLGEFLGHFIVCISFKDILGDQEKKA
jgi:hypothetical protein